MFNINICSIFSYNKSLYMKTYLFREINFYSFIDSIIFIIFSLLFLPLAAIRKILQHLDELYKWLHYTNIAGKILPLVQYWHNCYGITNCFLIGFESCSTGGDFISFQGTPCSIVWPDGREQRSKPTWGWKCR